jgi:two-component system sensor histidine kinase DegS
MWRATPAPARSGTARSVRLTLQRNDGALCLSIRDDGCGFDPKDVERYGHFGLLGMRERALRLGAALRVDSQPGRGTSIVVLMPAAPQRCGPSDREHR